MRMVRHLAEEVERGLNAVLPKLRKTVVRHSVERFAWLHARSGIIGCA